MKYDLKYLSRNNFFLIAGPCAVENESTLFEIAEHVKKLCVQLQIPYVLKASYKKANRSRIDSFSGIGDVKALKLLAKVGKELDLPVITDVHSVEEVKTASEFVDMLQIPAFLCRQTDLLVASAETTLPVNIKKGQFLSPEAMQFAVQKVKDSGNNQVLITERGTTFGYQDLVVDFRGIPLMKEFAPVILDVTHSLQQPNQSSGVTGGKPALIETIAKAGIAAGADGIFLETHPNPSIAKSDAANMLPMDQLKGLLEKLTRIKKVV